MDGRREEETGTGLAVRIPVPEDVVADFCRRHHIRRLSLFGSVLRDDFRPDSDIDVLVEFEPGHRIGLFGFGGLAIALSELLGHEVDLSTHKMLSPYFRDEVLQEAQTIYDAA